MSILPKLADEQDDLISSIDTGVRGFLEHHAYLVAMVGLVVYYGISRPGAHSAERTTSVSPLRYRVALISTTAGYGYSLLIAYLIVHRLHLGLFSLTLITIGMGTLFLVSDHGLGKTWRDAYDRVIRWFWPPRRWLAGRSGSEWKSLPMSSFCGTRSWPASC
jgi:hypothetical protein